MKKLQGPKRQWLFVLTGLAIMLVINTIAVNSFLSRQIQYVQYSEFIQMAQNGQIETVQIDTDEITFQVKAAASGAQTVFKTYRIADQYLVERLLSYGVGFGGVDTTPKPTFFGVVGSILSVAMYGLLIFMAVRLFRGGGEAGLGAMSFGKSSAKLYTVSDASKKFSDVAGQDEAKEALIELVDFLHQPEKYKAIGARLPKGALLVGPPGTGKTLIAQAVAGEANVPFFFVSGSAFVEMFVGTGAARVRDLFKQASEKAPCIVFIDEIDAIGKKRDAMGLNSNDEREQALNQLLAEMDGFDADKAVVVLGATNRPEILDRALLRPGRFDRRITVDLPDLRGREAVLRVHARAIQIGKGVDFTQLARSTVGASGADLANIVNEAALTAVRAGHPTVTQNDFEAAIERVIAGSERKSLVVPEAEKRMIAYHEIGHALVAAKQKHAAPVTKITIIPRTSGALGYTMQVDEDEHVLLSREDLLARMVVLAGGRAAEEFIFKTCTTGASNDIEQLTKLARSMVTRFGMSEKFGMMALETNASPYLGGDAQLACSFDTATLIDQEVQRLIDHAYRQALSIIQENARTVNALSEYLLERETLTGEEFMDILNRTQMTLVPPASGAAEETEGKDANGHT